MRIERLAFAAAALAASMAIIGCGSDKNNNSNTVVTTPSLGSTPLSTTPLSTTGATTMDTSSSGSATTAP